ncbi:MAG: cistern family PEP-CTERM protein [Pyrinomonadaceae bacterium]
MLPLTRKYIYTSLTFIAICLASAVTTRADSVIVGNANGALATAITSNVSLVGNTFTFTLTNTSPFDARITGVGFDLPPIGNASSSGLNGFSGSSNNANFAFSDADLGNVPQFNTAVLDFGFTTGNSGNFNGGSPNNGLAPGQSATFTVTGPFGNLTAAQIEASIFVRFQRVGLDGEGSDVGRPVGTPPPTAVPEPATMILLGTGLAGIAAKVRRRRQE